MGTELFTPDTIDILSTQEKTLIISPAVQGVVSSLIRHCLCTEEKMQRLLLH